VANVVVFVSSVLMPLNFMLATTLYLYTSISGHFAE